MYPCPTCERSFATKRGRAVHYTSTHDERLPNRTCNYCGTEFHSPYEKAYCSDECLSKADPYAGENNPNFRGGKEETECVLCGKSFSYYPSEKVGLYCAECVDTAEWREIPPNTGENNPRWSGGKREFECAVCAEPVERYPSNATGDVILCREACRRAWLSESFTGDGHPNWKGGGNEPYGEGWAATRRAALERDGYACVRCGTDADALGRNPDVHHIVPVRHYIEAAAFEKTDAHTLENVVTLCPPCHRKADFGHIAAETQRELIDVTRPTTVPAEPGPTTG